MRQNLESWLLALIEHKGAGRASVPDGSRIIAGRVTVAPFDGDFPTLDHERLADAKLALVYLTRGGYLRTTESGQFELTEVGAQRVALEAWTIDLARALTALVSARARRPHGRPDSIMPSI